MICLRAINAQDPSALPTEFHLMPDLIVGHQAKGKHMGLDLYGVLWGLPGGSMVMEVLVLDTYEELVAKVDAARGRT